jgi:hypothetical protein
MKAVPHTTSTSFLSTANNTASRRTLLIGRMAAGTVEGTASPR